MLINTAGSASAYYQISATHTTASVSSAYQATAAASSTRISGSYLEITGGVNGRYGSDGVDISEAAQEMLDRIRRLDIFSIIYPNSDPRKETKSLAEVEQDFLSDFSTFSSAFGSLSGMMGLSATDSFSIGLDGVGGVSVSGSSSATASAVQAGINGNSTAVSRFAVMAARAALVDAGNTVPGFSRAYSSDPVAAIGDNIDALKERLLGFRAVAGGGTAQYGFMRDFSLEYGSVSYSYAVGETTEA